MAAHSTFPEDFDIVARNASGEKGETSPCNLPSSGGGSESGPPDRCGSHGGAPSTSPAIRSRCRYTAPILYDVAGSSDPRRLRMQCRAILKVWP